MLLAASCWLSAVNAQPVPSFLLDTARVIGLDCDNVSATGAAIGDSCGLVVWVGGGSHVKGCRVRRDMSVIDSICLDISGPDYVSSAVEQHAVDVAWSGQNYLAVWFGPSGVCGSLVSSQGEVIRRLVIAEPGLVYYGVSVATDGSSFLVAWGQENGEFTREMYRLVSAEGTLLDTARPVSQSSGTQCSGDVEFGDSCYMIVFWRNDGQREHEGLSAVRIRLDGSLIDTVPVPILEGAASLAPTVGRIADNFYVAWGEGLDYTDIRFARITQDGVLIDSGGVLVGRDSGVIELSSAAARETCLLAWISFAGDTCHVRARRIDGLAHPLDSANLGISFANIAPIPPCGVSVSAPADFAVTWCQVLVGEEIGHQRSVACRRVSSSGIVIDSTDRALSYAANTQTMPDVASDGQSFLAVWPDVRKSSPLTEYLRMARFSSDGTRLDSLSIPVGDSSTYAPAVAYGAGSYMVCWYQHTGGKIEAARVSRDGVVLDTLPILVSLCSSKSSNVDVAYGDSMFLVVWAHGAGGVFGARVRSDGVLLDSAPKPMGDGSRFCFFPYVASEGHDFLVTHNDYPSRELHAARVSSAGLFMDTTELRLGRVQSSPQWYAPVAYGADVYMVYDWRLSRTWRISRDGEMLDSVTHLQMGGHTSTISFDGANFTVIGWRDAQTLAGQRISPSGVLLDPSPVALATLPQGMSELSSDIRCAMAADTSRNVGLVFTSYERPGYMSYRIRAAACPALSLDDAGTALPLKQKPLATICRGVLSLPEASNHKPQAASLLDIAGRKALDLKLGPNDVRALAPGVYFVRESQAQSQAIHKVVLLR